jgi:phenylpyruvate tautomerase PptA (4-oxalocrotonate tautomerase family)
MPLLKLETTVALVDDKKQALLASLSKIVAGTIGKPEQYVMVVISPAAILMSGKPGPAAFVDIRSIGGLGGNVNQQLAQKVGGLLKESLGVPPDRIYLNFTDIPAANWGWNGDTFGCGAKLRGTQAVPPAARGRGRRSAVSLPLQVKGTATHSGKKRDTRRKVQ